MKYSQVKKDVFDSGFDKKLNRGMDNYGSDVASLSAADMVYLKKLLSEVDSYGVNSLNDLTGDVSVVAGEGIDLTVNTADKTITVDGEDATTSNKGIASFDSDHFSVSSGAVSIKEDGIDDDLIDWGLGANQVDAGDMPILDAGEYYTGSSVEAALQEIGGGTTIQAFKTITGISEDVVADGKDDTLTLASSGGSLSIVGTAADDSINFDVATDGIDDTHIDWGTGANQVSAVDLPVADSGDYYSGTEVETALQEIGASSATEAIKLVWLGW